MHTRMEIFMGINPQENMEDKAKRQIMTAAVYKLHNTWRHNGVLQAMGTQEMQKALGLMIQDVVAGHPGAIKAVDTAWCQKTAATRRAGSGQPQARAVKRRR